MLVYLSKKIAIPNQVKLNCISWNRDQGYIACGGETGLLKVLKLETPSGPDALLQGVAASSNLSMNQTLEGHNGSVMCVTWNPIYRKLTTSDESGLIIVWIMHKSMWYEEMINNRNKSVVRDMKWTSDGRKIAIVYEDGAVIVGSVDGHRLWGKELKMSLRFVEWSPDSKLLLFVTYDAEVFVFDAEGNKLRTLQIVNQDSLDCMISSIHWYCPPNMSIFNGMYDSRSTIYTLCITFENGTMQLSRGDDASMAILIDTDLSKIDYVKWSTKGTYLAVVGTVKNASRSEKNPSLTSNVVKFYTHSGQYVRSLKIPGESINEISWEVGDLRLSLAVDSFIYFANIRHRYMYTFFHNTLAYTFPNVFKRDVNLVFWNTTTSEVFVKSVSNVLLLASKGEVCAVVTREVRSTAYASNKVGSASWAADAKIGSKSSNKDEKEDSPGLAAKPNAVSNDVYILQLRNSIGVITDSKVLPFMPKFIYMSEQYIVLANDRTVFTWQYNYNSYNAIYSNNSNIDDGALEPNDRFPDLASTSGGAATAKAKANFINKCKIFDITSINNVQANSIETFVVTNESILHPITCTYICDKYLMIAMKNGIVYRCNLPHTTVEGVYNLLDKEIVFMQCNSLFNKLAYIDSSGLCNVLDLDAKSDVNNDGSEGKSESKGEGKEREREKDRDGRENDYSIGPYGKKLPIERKDVWDLCWSEDDPNMLAIFEKTKMVIFNNTVAEEPVLCSAYVMAFKDLEVKTFAADDLFQNIYNFLNSARQSHTTLMNVSSNSVFNNPAYIINIESKVLRDINEKMTTENIESAYNYALNNPHSKLFNIIATAALEEQNYDIAQKCFVQLNNYFGIQFIKNVNNMTDKLKMKAEIYYYLQKFEAAENIYKEIDRKDLAVNLYNKLGNHLKVIQLLQTGGGNDKLLQNTYNNIGIHYYDNYNYKKAIQYFSLCHNYVYLTDCYYRLQYYVQLKQLIREIPEDCYLFYTLAQRFESIGMCEEAVECYIKCHNINSNNSTGDSMVSDSLTMTMQQTNKRNQSYSMMYSNPLAANASSLNFNTINTVKLAIDCAVKYNKWHIALYLSETYNYPQIESILIKYAHELIMSNKLLTCIELFRVANRPTESAILINNLATNIANNHNLLLAKKLYILSALEIERHKQKTLDGNNPNASVGATLNLTNQNLDNEGSNLDNLQNNLNNVNIAEKTANTVQTLMMTNLLEGTNNNTNNNNTLQMTLTTLQTLNTATGGTQSTNKMNKKLSKAFANAWRGAAAYHYYMLAMRQFYAGALDASMKTCIKLCEYDDILPARSIYSLLCLASYKNGFFATCSKSLVKLETLPNLSESDREAFQSLAVKVFTRHSPQDPAPLMDVYSLSLDLGRSFKACILTGRAVQDSPTYMCRTCRHYMLEYEIENFAKHAFKFHSNPYEKKGGSAGLVHCPLCHTPILTSTLGNNKK